MVKQPARCIVRYESNGKQFKRTYNLNKSEECTQLIRTLKWAVLDGLSLQIDSAVNLTSIPAKGTDNDSRTQPQ